MIKPGYLTSEFAVVLAAMVVSLLVAIGLPAKLGMSSSTLQEQIASALVGVLPVAYATLRTWLKSRFNVTLPPTVPSNPLYNNEKTAKSFVIPSPLQAPSMPVTALAGDTVTSVMPAVAPSLQNEQAVWPAA